jgi:hypothetical protein
MSEELLKISVQVSFTRPATTTPAATEITLVELSPITGIVREIELHFPNGCNGLVEVKCFINQVQILPVTGYIALNDFTRSYTVNREITRNDNLRVIITNRDAVNQHTPSIIFDMEGIP